MSFLGGSGAPSYNRQIDAPARYLQLLSETIAAVNSTLDLEEVLGLVARKVAEALEADACFVYLYDEQADELVLRATHGTRVEEMTRTPRMRPGEGITGTAAADRSPIMIPGQAHLDERFKAFPNLPEDEYESILAVPILARTKLAGALNVRTIEPREFAQAEIDLLVAIAAQVAQTIEHAKLYADAQARVSELEALAKISEAVSESLYLEESLEAIVKTTMEAVGATGAALVLEDGNIAWPEGRPGAHAIRLPLRWKRRAIGELVCDRDTPFTERGARTAHVHRPPRGSRSRAWARRHAWRPRPGDPPPSQEQSPDCCLAAAAAGALGGHRSAEGARGLGQPDPRDRRRARGADGAARRGGRLDELLDRLRAMLVQGLGAEKHVETALAHVTLAGGRATALALVFSELLQNALEHGGDSVRVELAQRDGEVVLAIADDGDGIADEAGGTGLSIVRALVRDELRGTLELTSDGGLRAEVVFPA